MEKICITAQVDRPIRNKLEKNAAKIGVPMSAYVRQIFAEELKTGVVINRMTGK